MRHLPHTLIDFHLLGKLQVGAVNAINPRSLHADFLTPAVKESFPRQPPDPTQSARTRSVRFPKNFMTTFHT